MELQPSTANGIGIGNNGRYIECMDDGFTSSKRRKSQGCATTETKYFCHQYQQPPEERDDSGGGWNEFAATVHNIGDFIWDWKDTYCQGPCFVQTSTSMDSTGGSPSSGGTRLGAPQLSSVTTPVISSNSNPSTNATKHSLSCAPLGPIHFPSLHLDMDDWEHDVEDDDSAFLLADGAAITTASKHHHRQQSIYRTPSAMSSPVSKFAQKQQQQKEHGNNNQEVSVSIMPNGNRQISYGLYRSPAWSDEDDNLLHHANISDDQTDHDDDDDDWDDISPGRNNVDIHKMNALFQNGCTLSHK